MPVRRASFRERTGWGLSEALFFCVLALALSAVLYCARFAYGEGSLLEAAKGNAQLAARWAESVAAANEQGKAFPPQACSLLSLPPPAAPEAATGVLPEGQSVQAPPRAEAGLVAEVSDPAAATPAASMPVAAHGDKPAAEGGDAHAPESAQALAASGPAPAASAPGQPAAPTWQACRQALFAQGGPLAGLANPFNAKNTVLGTRCERKSAATRGHVLVEKGTPPPPGMPGSVSWGPLEDKEPIAKGLMLRIQVCDAGGYAIKVAEVTL
jgi:hypothetical protein